MAPSKRYTSQKDRKRTRLSDSEDEFESVKHRNGKSQFKIEDLLRTYRDNQLNSSERCLKYVPQSVTDVFVPYVKHVQTINNSLHSIKLLFRTNQKLLKPELLNKFHEFMNNTENKMNKLSDDLINQLTANFDQDPVYESMKAACVDPVVSLDKLEDPENLQNSSSVEKSDPYDDFVDSDIDLQIIEACDSVSKSNQQRENQSYDTNMTKSNDNDTCIKKRILPEAEHNDVQQNLKYDDDGYLVIYTDGCCLSNGQNSAQAGIGVWFNHNHSLNIALPVKGPPTNNNAEIQAATKAILTASSLNQKKVRICTDSMFLINCMTTWIHRWKKNNWKTSDKAPVKNRESLQELDNVLSLVESVDWKYVPGHRGVVGNEGADTLAKEGAKLYARK